MKISKTPTLLIALTLTSMIAGGCAIDDTETDPETDDAAEIEESVGEADLGEFEGAATSARHGCVGKTCTIRLDRNATKAAHTPLKVAEIGKKACRVLKNAAASAYCADAVYRGRVRLAEHATAYYKAGNCLGIRYKKYFKGAPPTTGEAVQVKIKTYNCVLSKGTKPLGRGFDDLDAEAFTPEDLAPPLASPVD